MYVYVLGLLFANTAAIIKIIIKRVHVSIQVTNYKIYNIFEQIDLRMRFATLYV